MNRTKLQNSHIHALKNKNHISDDNYRAAVLAVSNGRTDTSKELTQKEADELIVKLGGNLPTHGRATKPAKRPAKSNVVALVSEGQKRLIGQLATRRWGKDYTAPLQALCNSPRVLNKPYPKTQKEAQRLIETLKAMNKRPEQKPAAQAA